MNEITLCAASSIAPAQLHATFVIAFADYLLGPFALTLEQWPGFLARQGVSLEDSRVALHENTPVAFALVAKRPRQQRWRLATMGAVPEARGSGAAGLLLDDMVSRAKHHGNVAVELEVFAQNDRAWRLYQGRGFVRRCDLYGFQHQTGHDQPAVPAVETVELANALRWLDETEQDIADLPLQVTAGVLGALTATLTAWRCGQAQLVFLEGPAQTLTVSSLIDRDPRQEDARRLLQYLCSRYPGYAVNVPQLQREDLGGTAMRSLGFNPLPLHQWLMVRELV